MPVAAQDWTGWGLRRWAQSWVEVWSVNPVFPALLCTTWGLPDTWTRFWNSVPALPRSPSVLNLQHFPDFFAVFHSFRGRSHGSFYAYLLEKHQLLVLVPIPVWTSSPLGFLVSWTLAAPTSAGLPWGGLQVPGTSDLESLGAPASGILRNSSATLRPLTLSHVQVVTPHARLAPHPRPCGL